MPAELLIALEREIPEFDSGAAAVKLASDPLDRLADALGVRPLSEFVRIDPHSPGLAGNGPDPEIELSDSGEVDALGVIPAAEGAGEGWCDPREGLNTIRAYLDHLGRNPRAVRDPDAVAVELRGYQRVLERAATEDVRFTLVLEIGWPPESRVGRPRPAAKGRRERPR